jgi:hypothetical protein
LGCFHNCATLRRRGSGGRKFVIAKATDAIKWLVNFMTDTMPYEGACHCGALQFRLNTRPPSALLRCNCSICELEDFLHWIMPLSHFEWISGEANTYRFGSGVARHTFCPTCGVKPFYFPRSNPDGVSINARCVPGLNWRALPVDEFDGQHWEQNAATLSHLSSE